MPDLLSEYLTCHIAFRNSQLSANTIVHPVTLKKPCKAISSALTRREPVCMLCIIKKSFANLTQNPHLLCLSGQSPAAY